MERDLHYHLDRALAELNQAMDAKSRLAADAHYHLSSLHLERLDQIRRDRRPRLFLV